MCVKVKPKQKIKKKMKNLIEMTITDDHINNIKTTNPNKKKNK
jgi:hypothetical protein